MNKEKMNEGHCSTIAVNILNAVEDFTAAMKKNGLDVLSIGLSPEHCAQLSFYCTKEVIKNHFAAINHEAPRSFKVNYTLTQGAIYGVEITSAHPINSAEAQK